MDEYMYVDVYEKQEEVGGDTDEDGTGLIQNE